MNGLWLAMIYWRFGRKDEARQAFENVKADCENRAEADADLRQFLHEAEDLLGIPPEPETAASE